MPIAPHYRRIIVLDGEQSGEHSTADHKPAIAEKELAGKGSGRRAIGKEDYQAKGEATA